MRNKKKNFPLREPEILDITISKEFGIISEVICFLEQYELDNKDRIEGIKYKDGCSFCHIIKLNFCEVLQFLQMKGILSYIPISDDSFDVIIKGELTKKYWRSHKCSSDN